MTWTLRNTYTQANLLWVGANIGVGWLLFVVMDVKSIDGNKVCVIHGQGR
jgi:hypothetical protein